MYFVGRRQIGHGSRRGELELAGQGYGDRDENPDELRLGLRQGARDGEETVWDRNRLNGIGHKESSLGESGRRVCAH